MGEVVPAVVSYVHLDLGPHMSRHGIFLLLLLPYSRLMGPKGQWT